MYPHSQDYEERINSSTEAERAAKEVATREAAAEADKAKAAEAAARAAKAASWDSEETRLLEKALVKFPVVRPVFSRVTGKPFKQSAELTGEPIKMKA